jgi:hypothetical protein
MVEENGVVDENVDMFKADEYVDRADTSKARQSQLLEKGWYTPSSVTVLQRVATDDQKNPGRRNVDVNFTFEKEDGTLAFVTMYTSPDKDNEGQYDYRFRIFAKAEKLYTEANALNEADKVSKLDVINYLREGAYQVHIVRTKDDENMVEGKSPLRIAR